MAELVKVIQTVKGQNPSENRFEISEDGRLYALKVDRTNGDYTLHVFVDMKFDMLEFSYKSQIFVYEYNANSDLLTYSKFIDQIANEKQYVREDTGEPVDKSVAVLNNVVRAGYLTEAQWFEKQLGPTIASFRQTALERLLGY